MKRLLIILIIGLFLSMGIVSAIGTIPTIDKSFVHYYQLNNGTGENDTYIKDFSLVNSDNGTVLGSAIFNVTGGYFSNGTFEFDGIDDYINISDSDSFSIISQPENQTTFSVFFKLYPDEKGDGSNARQFIFSKGITTSFEYGLFRTNTTDGNKIQFSVYNATGTADTVTLLNGYQFNKWYHAIITVNSTLITPYLFLSDGTNDSMNRGSTALLTNNIINGVAPFQIGKRADQNFYLNGSVDEFLMLNYSMSKSEAWNLHQTYIGCTNLTNAFFPQGNTLLCNSGNQVYNLAGTTDGAVQVNNMNNAYFDCNGATIRGNNTFNFVGINLFQRDNITLRNCKIQNYHTGLKVVSNINSLIHFNNFTDNNRSIWMSLNGAQGGRVDNNYFYNESYAGIWFSGVNISVLNISHNTFDSYQPSIYDEPSNSNLSLYIYNNTFNQFTVVKAISTHITSDNWIIDSNRVNSAGLSLSYGIDIRGDNTLIKGNLITKCQYCINVVTKGNTTILNNTVYNADEGMQIYASNNVYIYNNSFKNITANYDGYDTGSKIKHSNNIHIIGNNFSEVATTGLFAQNSSGIIIRGNWFYSIPLNLRSIYSAKDYGDPSCAVSIVELYKSYIGNGEEGSDFDMNITKISRYKSNNITVIDNTYDSNTGCYLRTEGTTNLTHNLSGVWYRKFQAPTQIKDNMEFWIANNHSNLSSYYGSPAVIDYRITSNFFGARQVEYILTRDYVFINNTNLTRSYGILYNITNGIFYLKNGTGVRVVDNELVNTSIAPNNYGYALDNYNCSESSQNVNGFPCGRQYSPINITGRTIGSYILSLSSNITNVITIPITMNITSCSGYNRMFMENITVTDLNVTNNCQLARTTGLTINIAYGNSRIGFYEETNQTGTNNQTGTSPIPEANDGSSSTIGQGIGKQNSTDSTRYILNMTGLNNALLYNNSYNVYGSKEISNNDGSLVLNITGDEVVYILNNYYKDERYYRDYDPLMLVEVTGSERFTKKIISSLKDTINISYRAIYTSPINLYSSPSIDTRLYMYNITDYTYDGTVSTLNLTIDGNSSYENIVSMNYMKNNGASVKNITLRNQDNPLYYFSNGSIESIAGTGLYKNISLGSQEWVYIFSGVDIGELYQTYEARALVDTTQSYSLTVVYDRDVYNLTARLIYNGSSYNGVPSFSGNQATFSQSILMTYDMIGTQGFYWEMNLSNSTSFALYNSSLGTQEVLTQQALITFVDYFGNPQNASGYYTDGNTTNKFTNVTYLTILPDNVSIGRVNVYWGWQQDILNYSQFYDYNNDGVTGLTQQFTLINNKDISNWFRVIDNSGNPIEDALIRVSFNYPSLGGTYKEFGQRYTNTQGYTYFFFDSDSTVNIRVTKDGYDPLQEEMDLNAQSYGFSNPKTFVLVKNVNGVNNGAIFRVYPNYFIPMNTTSLGVSVYAPEGNQIKYTTSYRIQNGFGNSTISLNNYKNALITLNSGTDFPSINTTEPVIFYGWVDENEWGNITINPLLKDTTKFNPPSGTDNNFLRGFGWIVLLLLTGVLGLFIKGGDEAVGEGRRGKTIFFLGIIMFNIVFPLILGVLLVIIALHYGLLFIRKWISE